MGVPVIEALTVIVLPHVGKMVQHKIDGKLFSFLSFSNCFLKIHFPFLNLNVEVGFLEKSQVNWYKSIVCLLNEHCSE